jgi:hypothetical protein
MLDDFPQNLLFLDFTAETPSCSETLTTMSWQHIPDYLSSESLKLHTFILASM